MLKFGSIFRIQGKEDYYVYLAQKDDLFFAARILNSEMTAMLEKRQIEISRKPQKGLLDSPMFCYVVLTRGEFKDCAANYGKPDQEQNIPIDYYSELEAEDVESLKDEILRDDVAMPALKQVVKEVFGVK